MADAGGLTWRFTFRTPGYETPGQEACDMNPTSVMHDLDAPTAAERLCQSRARSLLAQADRLPMPLASAYRRRAQELELEAYLIHQTAA